MALIRCPECNREISSTVKNCPQCGCDVALMMKDMFQIKFLRLWSDNKVQYCFEKYPDNGNIGVTYINTANVLGDYKMQNNIISICYNGICEKYLLTPFGFIFDKGDIIPDGEKIDYTLQREGQNIKFKLNGTGRVNDYEMKYYKSDNFLLLRIKIYNNYTCEKFVKFNGKWYSIFYATMNMNGRSDLIQEYNELINRYNNDKGKTQNVAINSVACPYCHSRNTSKIGTVSRMFSAGFFGLGSKKIGKQWHCNSCGSDF